MGLWWWVLVFVAIAALGVVLYALLALRLWRKAKVLLREAARLSEVVATTERELQSVGAHPAAAPLGAAGAEPDNDDWVAAVGRRDPRS